MLKRTSRQLIGLAVVGVLGAAAFFVSKPALSDTPGLEITASSERIIPTSSVFQSEIVETDFPFNGIGAQLNVDSLQQNDENISLKMRFTVDGTWTDWTELPILHDLKDGWESDGTFFTEPYFIAPSTAWQFELRGDITSIEFTYFDTSTKRSATRSVSDFFRSLLPDVSASGSVPVTPRSGWGADESWRKKSDGTDLWPAEYAQPQKMIVHHTAGSDGGSDPAAIVRGIYYWHAVVLGWGDIGYNYLIDKNGTIYEGRAGGDGVVGGHTFNEQKGVGYNRGSIGIALLGDFQTNGAPTAAATEALTALLTDLGVEFGVEPAGNGFFVDQNLPNVIGHKDVDNTSCPGVSLFDLLPNIRADAQNRYTAAGGAQQAETYAAQFSQMSGSPIEVKAGTEQEIWTEFQNNGSADWRTYGSDSLKVVSVNAASTLRASGWSTDVEAGQLTSPNVEPGQVGRFTFTIKAPTDQLFVSEDFQLSHAGQVIEGTRFTVKIQVTDLPYAATFPSNTIRPATFINGRNSVTVTVKNEGTTTWQKSSTKLKVYDLGKRPSAYADTSWASSTGSFAFKEQSVAPGGTATFTFTMRSPRSTGRYLNIFTIEANKQAVVGGEFQLTTRVDSTTQASFVSNTLPHAILNTWRPSITVTLKNTGITVWSRSSIVLNIYDSGLRTSRFRDKSWPNTSGGVRMKESSVKPGQTATFTFLLDAPNPGLYKQIFQLRDSKNQPISGGESQQLTRVD